MLVALIAAAGLVVFRGVRPGNEDGPGPADGPGNLATPVQVDSDDTNSDSIQNAGPNSEDVAATDKLVQPLLEPDYGSAAYLTALADAERFRPLSRGEVLQESISTIDLSGLSLLYDEILADGASRSPKSLPLAIRLDFGVDSCTLVTASVRQRSTSTVLMGSCNELPNSTASFVFDPALRSFQARIYHGKTEYYVFTLDDHQHAASFTIDASSIRHSD